MEDKETNIKLLETAIRIEELLRLLVSGQAGTLGEQVATIDSSTDQPLKSKRRTIHVRDLVLAEGDWLMNTPEALSVLGISRGTLDVHREQGELTDVTIGKKGGGVRFIASEVEQLRKFYSVRKGKV